MTDVTALRGPGGRPPGPRLAGKGPAEVVAAVAPFAWIAVFSVATNLLVLAVPLYLLQMYDRVLTSRSIETLIYISIIAIAALVTYGLIEVARSVLAHRAASRFEARNGARVYRSVLAQAAGESGDVQPLRDMATVRGFIASRTAIGLFDLPFMPLFAVLIFFVHPILGALTITGAVVLILIAVANEIVTRRAERSASEAAIRAAAVALAQRQAGEEMRAMAMLERGFDTWGALEAQAINGQDRVGRINATFYGVSRTTRLCLQIAILGFGALLVLEQGLSAGIIFAASMVSARALGPIDQVIGGWRSIAQALLAWRRLKGRLDRAAEDGEATRLPQVSGRIEVDKLVYAPQPGQEPVLRRLSFRLDAGECIAIIGPSGAGKSTLARILAGAIEPTSGAVRLDGIALCHWHEQDRGAATGYLAQDANLFPASVAHNIARLDADPDEHAVVNAAQFTGTHEFIGSLPQAYATPVGPGGLPLSGGQKQRVGLARAFFGNPRFVVLDEPDAHLDEVGLRALDLTLARAKQAGITTVVVTQRKAMLARADRIMVLSGGLIERFGPRAEVVQALNERTAANGQKANVAPLGPYRANRKAAPGGLAS